jgi:hypothetical protein
MTIHNVQQGDAEWFELKWAKIGGTRSKGLFSTTDTLFNELLGEYTEQYEEIEEWETDATARGKALEPEARQKAEEYLGVKFEQVGWIHDESLPLLGISPDGLTSDNKIGLEIKCFGRTNHVKIANSETIPSDNIHQCVHYFTVCDELEELYFVAYRPEALKKLVVIKLTRESIVKVGQSKKAIHEWVEIARAKAEEINKALNKSVEKMSF